MPFQSLNIIVLISGGKDSLFSLLHCIQNGHKIIALANMYPVSNKSSGKETGATGEEGEDVNSFMYQTVGHTIIPLYAEALNLPLYRRQISGKSVNVDRDYAFNEQDLCDETEDLVPLLQEIMHKHPEVNALSSGAILSTYQRTRIESVAVRLRLTPVAYLWQYPALPPPIERKDSVAGLLDDMEAAGCDARVIKIASAGMKDSLLWSRISDPLVRNQISASMSRFSDGDEFSLRGAILGEGGEYETLAVNGPPQVWKKKIQIDGRSNILIQDDDGVSRLVFGKPSLVEQSGAQVDVESPLVCVPVLLDDKFSFMGQKLQVGNMVNIPLKSASWTCPELKQNTSQAITSFTINNVTDPGFSKDVTEQTTAIINWFDAIVDNGTDSTRSSSRVVATTIILRHMSDFAAVNVIYGKRFNHVNPPARVTICCGDSLPQSIHISISFTLTQADSASVNGLHVQSISYWAPANIGPYSQAIKLPTIPSGESREKIVYLAGQIPLVPSSMELLRASFLDQAVLSLQHLWRVGQCLKVDCWTYGVAYLADVEVQNLQKRARVAWEVWREANAQALGGIKHEDEEASDEDGALDAWDLKYNHQLDQSSRTIKHLAYSHLHELPNPNMLKHDTTSSPAIKTTVPPFLAVHVYSLPRSASIEWHSLGLANLSQHPISKPRLTLSTTTNKDLSVSICQLEPFPPSSSRTNSDEDGSEDKDKNSIPTLEFFSIQIFNPVLEDSFPLSPNLDRLTHHLRVALSHLSQNENNPQEQEASTNPLLVGSNLTIYISSQAGHDALTTVGLAESGMLIPCRSLWGEEGRKVEIAILGYR